MLTATAMGHFQHEIEKAVVLSLFIPLIISSGGNSGSQAATLIIRAMAVKELSLRDWWYVMRREIFSGLTLGSIAWLYRFFTNYCMAKVSSMGLWATLDVIGDNYFLFIDRYCNVGNI